MSKRKPCNHRNRYYMGDRTLLASPKPDVVVAVYWCHVCGAITFANGWMYPSRALESTGRKKAAK